MQSFKYWESEIWNPPEYVKILPLKPSIIVIFQKIWSHFSLLLQKFNQWQILHGLTNFTFFLIQAGALCENSPTVMNLTLEQICFRFVITWSYDSTFVTAPLLLHHSHIALRLCNIKHAFYSIYCLH